MDRSERFVALCKQAREKVETMRHVLTYKVLDGSIINPQLFGKGAVVVHEGIGRAADNQRRRIVCQVTARGARVRMRPALVVREVKRHE